MLYDTVFQAIYLQIEQPFWEEVLLETLTVWCRISLTLSHCHMGGFADY